MFALHVTTISSVCRFLQYHNWGGKEKMLKAKTEEGMSDVKVAAGEATEKARGLVAVDVYQ
jgi:hypothetical protein